MVFKVYTMDNESNNNDQQQPEPDTSPQLRGQSNVAENAPDLELPAATGLKTFGNISTDKHQIGLSRFVVLVFLFFYVVCSM